MAESAFIPKTIQTSMRTVQVQRVFGILPFMGIVLLFLALAILGGLFLYKGFLERQIQSLHASIGRLEADFDPPLIQELSRISRRIESSKSLLGQRLVPSRLFQFLEENTLAEVRFSDFSFDVSRGDVIMSGEAKSYTALAQEDEILKKHPSVKRVGFSNFSLQPSGNVNFEVEINFDPRLISSR